MHLRNHGRVERHARVAFAVAVSLVLVVAVAAPRAAARTSPDDSTTETEGSPPEGDAQPNGVSAFGDAMHLGPIGGLDLAAPVVDIAGASTGAGYWMAAADGGVFSFGDALFHGSAGDLRLREAIVGIAAHPSGEGYWLVAADGGVFSFGEATFHGSTGDIDLVAPMVGIAATPSGDGYWLVASDGGVFAFGDAEFLGSAGSIPLAAPVVDMAATVDGDGYWLLSADGGVFDFGRAEHIDSEADEEIAGRAVGIAAEAGGDGYWIATSAGEVYAEGVTEQGSPGEVTDDPAPVAGIAAHPDDGYWLAHGERTPLEDDASGPQVAALQRRLEALGYWVGPIDGVFGDLTRQAVYAFQKYEGLSVDGVVGAVTRARLGDAVRPRPLHATGDHVEIDKSRQLLFVVRGGDVMWVFNSSTGSEDPYRFEGDTYDAETPTGAFSVLRDIDGWRTSRLGRLYRPKYFTTTGIAVHGSASVPPSPASHGCVRVSLAAMDVLWATEALPIDGDVFVYGSIRR